MHGLVRVAWGFLIISVLLAVRHGWSRAILYQIVQNAYYVLKLQCKFLQKLTSVIFLQGYFLLWERCKVANRRRIKFKICLKFLACKWKLILAAISQTVKCLHVSADKKHPFLNKLNSLSHIKGSLLRRPSLGRLRDEPKEGLRRRLH